MYVVHHTAECAACIELCRHMDPVMGIEVELSGGFKGVWLQRCLVDAGEPKFTDYPSGSAQICACRCPDFGDYPSSGIDNI